MKYGPVKKTTKEGTEVVFKSADITEAAIEIDCLKRCCAETRFLLAEAEEIEYTVESEEEFLVRYEESERSLLLNAYVNGELVGNGSFAPVHEAKRLAHRCSLGIALFQDFCGQGIGELLLRILFDQAKAAGFEIMELDVVSGNARAIHLYEKLGFEKYGERKRAIRYKDGSYADEYLMAKIL